MGIKEYSSYLTVLDTLLNVTAQHRIRCVSVVSSQVPGEQFYFAF